MIRFTRRALLPLAFAPFLSHWIESGRAAPPATPAATPAPSQSVNPFDILEMPGAAAVAMMIRNEGPAPDRLIGGACALARLVQLHVIAGGGETRRMEAVAGIPIPPGITLFDREGPHVMLVGLRRGLVQGELFDLTLRFADAGDVTVPVRVRRRVDAAGVPLPPPVTAGALTISLASTIPTPMLHATPIAGAPVP